MFDKGNDVFLHRTEEAAATQHSREDHSTGSLLI